LYSNNSTSTGGRYCAPFVGSQLGNISTRVFVQTGDNVVIGGFIVQGAQTKRVMIRAIGPELGAPPYHVPNALANPTLELHISTRSFVLTEDNVMIGGFSVQCAQTKRVMIRAIGPDRTQYGVPSVLADPTLELHNGTGALIASNDNCQHTIIGSIITGAQVQD